MLDDDRPICNDRHCPLCGERTLRYAPHADTFECSDCEEEFDQGEVDLRGESALERLADLAQELECE